MQGYHLIDNFLRRVITQDRGAGSSDSLTGHAVFVTAVALANYILMFVAHLVMTRWMGSKGFGDYSVAMSIANIAAVVAPLGTHMSVMKEVPQMLQKGRYGAVRGFFLASMFITFVAGVLLGLGIVAFEFIFQSLGKEYEESLWLAAAFIPLMGLVMFLNYALISSRAVILPSLNFQVVFPVVLIGLCWWKALVWGDLDAIDGIVFTGIAKLVNIAMYYGTLHSQTWFRRWREYPSEWDWLGWTGRGLPFLIYALTSVALVNIPIIVLEILSNNETDTGVFAVVFGISTILTVVYTALISIVGPLMSPLVAANDRENLQTLMDRTFWVALATSVLLGLVMVFFGKPILAWYGDEFVRGYNALLIIYGGGVIGMLFSFSTTMLQYAGRQVLVNLAYLGGTIGIVVFSAAFIPFNGVDGAAWGYAIPSSLMYIGLTIYAGRFMHIRMLPLWPRRGRHRHNPPPDDGPPGGDLPPQNRAPMPPAAP